MSTRFTASGVISITTDFGHRGPFVGTMKGVLLSRFAAVQVVDLTHEAYVHWPAEAGFWVARSYHYFPRGSVHLAVVDPGVGTDRSILLAEFDGHAFLAPDNGLLGEILERDGALARRIDTAVIDRYRLHDLSATFHGRDLFAPLAAALASGELAPGECGTVIDDFVPSILEPPERRGDQLAGVVITTDHFGNLITNITRAGVEGFATPVVQAAGREIAVRRTYGDVQPGELLALVNSFDVLEIACAEQNAAEQLGLRRGAPVRVRERAG